MNIHKFFNLVVAFVFAFSLLGMPAPALAQEPQPSFNIRANIDQVEAFNWTMGDTLTLTIDDPDTEDDPDHTAVQVVTGTADWDPTQTYLSFDFSGVYDVQVGDEISVINGTITKNTVVMNLAFTDVDLETDIVSGVAESNQVVNIWTCYNNDPCVNRDETADNNGYWTTNFAIPGEQDWEQATANLRPGSWIDSAVNDDDGDNTMFGWSVPNPSFSARLTDNEVHGYQWPLGASVTLTIGDPNNGGYTATQTVGVADWDPNQTFVQFRVWEDGFSLERGMTVSMSDGQITKTHVVTNLVVTDVDPNADTVSGTADPGTQVDIGHMYCDQSGCYGFRRVFADPITGNWIADFAHVGEDNDEQDIFDIRSGTGSEARQCDEDGECTHVGWYVSDPRMEVSYEHDWIQINDFTPGGNVTYTIYDHQGGHALFGPVTGPVDSHGSGWISSNLHHTDLIPGNYITAVNETTGEEVSILIRDLNLDYVGVDDDRVFGTAAPNTTIEIHISETQNQGFNLTADVNSLGYWEVDLAAEGHPIESYRHAGIRLYDAEGDNIMAQPPRVHANISTDDFRVDNFSKNADVTLTLYDSPGGAILYGPVTLRTEGSGNAWVNLWGTGIDLIPGNYIVARDHTLNFTKSLEIEPFTFDEINAADDYVRGTSAAGEWVSLHVESLFSNWGLDALTAENGQWFRDYGLDNYDITDQMWANGWATDDQDNWSEDHTTGLPGIEASLADDWISGFNFSPDRQVRVRIYDSEDGNLLRDVSVTAGGNTQLHVDPGQHGVDLQPGMYILAEDLETGKYSELTLVNLTFAGVNYDTDTAWGKADPFARVVVRANHLFDNYEITVIADGSGDWLADFSSYGADINSEWNLRAMIFDLEFDATVAQAPQPPVFTASLDGNWVNGNNWTPNNNVSINIYGSEGGPSIGETFTWGTDNYGNFNANLWNEGVDLLPGNYITVTDNFSGVVKDLTLPNLTIDYLDPVNDVAGGLAPADTRLNIDFNNQQESIQFDLFSESDGTWEADFGAHDFDLQPGSSGNVRISDEDGDTIQVDGRVLTPYIEASPNGNWIHAREWPIGTVITMALNGSSDTYTATMGQAPWNPGDPNDIVADFALQGYDVQAGDVITASANGTTKTLTISQLAVTNFDVEADTLSGMGTSGFQIQVCANVPNRCITRWVMPNGSGNWTANYHDPGTGNDDPDTFDVQPGSNGWAADRDEDGDQTWLDWNVPNPFIIAFPENEAVEGWEWPDGTVVHLTVDDPATGLSPDFEQDKVMAVTTWGDPRTYTRFDFADLYDLKVGDIVTVTNGLTPRTHIVQNLSVTAVDAATDTITGQANPGAVVVVWPHGFDQVATVQVTAGEDGIWLADFSGLFDLVFGTGGRSQILDETGNATAVDWNVPNSRISVRLDGNSVTGYEWPLETDIVLTIDDPATTYTSVDYFATAQMAQAPWGETIVFFDLNGLYVVKPGDIVTLQGGGLTRSHTVFHGLSFGSADVVADTISGTASDGASIQVNQCDDSGCADRYIESVTGGIWTVDFSVEGPRDDEKVLRDLQPGMGGEVWQFDEGGNSTVRSWYIPNPTMTLKGFYQPVDMNGVFNIVKGGSTVPLKFEIFVGATELTDIAYIKSLTYAQTSCDASAITDEIETIATGGTSLRYDTTAGQFIYNWKTPKSAGKCYRVTMTTIDNSSLVAYFKFK